MTCVHFYYDTSLRGLTQSSYQNSILCSQANGSVSNLTYAIDFSEINPDLHQCEIGIVS